MSSKCIFCYTEIPPQCSPKQPPDIMAMALSDSLEPEMRDLTTCQIPKKDLLSQNLDVIFILRKIFKIPSTQLSSYLKSCPDIGNWITICVNCDKIVKEFTTLYRKCQDAKCTLVKKVKDTCGKENENFGMILDITEECRQFVVKHECPNTTNPFIEGDLRALQLLKSGRYQRETRSVRKNMKNNFEKKVPDKLNDSYDDDYFDDDYHDDSDFKISEDKKSKPLPPKKKRIRNRNLKCPEPNCSSEFKRRIELNVHLIEVHNTQPKPSKPSLNKRKYPDEYYVFSENNKCQYQLKIPSKCDLCSKEFQSQFSLANHLAQMDLLLQVKTKKKLQCKICGEGISNHKNSLKTHEARCLIKSQASAATSSQRSRKEKRYTLHCPVENCGILFDKYMSLEIHYRHHHREMEHQPCQVENCPENFYTEAGLEYHLKQKHKERRPFKCNHCGKGFLSKDQLEGHKKRVAAREEFEKDPLNSKSAVICNYCGRSFPHEVSLKSHVRRVHEDNGNAANTCEHCGKRSGKPEHLNIHLWKVHGRRDVPLKWRCEVEGCGRICYTKGQLELHMTRHTGTPQFCCEECGKEFYDKHHLKEHVMAMHESRKGGEKVKCELCGMEFEYWKYMERHKRTVHENKKRKPKNKQKKIEECEVMKDVVESQQTLIALEQEINMQVL